MCPFVTEAVLVSFEKDHALKVQLEPGYHFQKDVGGSQNINVSFFDQSSGQRSLTVKVCLSKLGVIN